MSHLTFTDLAWTTLPLATRRRSSGIPPGRATARMVLMDSARIRSIHVGQIAPLGKDGVLSAFVKRAVATTVEVTPLGLVGDSQADLRVHGGPEKAVYGYATANYAAWRTEYPQHSRLLVPGGFGENLAIDGMMEADLCVGDVHEIGGALLQVCQPRQPCFKFALRFDDTALPRAWSGTADRAGTTGSCGSAR